MMKYHIQVFISTLLFALSFVWSKQAMEYLTPVALVTGRIIIASILVTAITALSGKMQRLRGRDYLWFLALAAAEPVGYFIFENEGLSRVSPTLACLIIGLVPIFTPFGAWLVSRERISRRSWIGLIAGFLGVGVFTLGSGGATIDGNIAGVLLLFGAVLTAVIYTLMVQKMSERFNSFSLISWVSIFSLPYLFSILYLFDYNSIANFSFDWGWFYPMLMLGIMCSSVAFVLYANGVRELGATKTAMYINLMPGITAVASYFIMGEELSVIEILGILITIFGLFIANFSNKQKQ